MITLFIDTHDSVIRIALIKDNKILAEKTRAEKKDHSTVCMPTLVSLMNDCHLSAQDLSDIVVVNGPGSFTGERLGVTIAKTLAYTLNIPIRTITSIETCLQTVSLSKNTFLSLSEKNGYFLALFNKDKQLINDYFYLSKKEYQDFCQNNQVCEVSDYNILESVLFAHQKQPINPHQVNPFYVKKIEVLND